jgi:hypothetical protein
VFITTQLLYILSKPEATSHTSFTVRTALSHATSGNFRLPPDNQCLVRNQHSELPTLLVLVHSHNLTIASSHLPTSSHLQPLRSSSNATNLYIEIVYNY